MLICSPYPCFPTNQFDYFCKHVKHNTVVFMRTNLLMLLLTLSFLSVQSAEVTMIITSVPANTPDGDQIYIAGNFNNWNPGNPDFILHPNNNGQAQIVIEGTGAIEFKFTRGSWQSVEGSATGGFLPNRKFTFGSTDTLYLAIQSWEDTGGQGSTAASNVVVMSNSFFMPQLNRTRRIWLYLPPDYDSTTNHYPVLYMHDGQNLFDLYTSFSGEWEVDESLNSLYDAGKQVPIVVGIDNGGEHRIAEYTPWTNPQYGGGEGDFYARFIVETLKPYIDENYRTLPQREHTGIMGSSLGGLISHYIGLKYQDVFSMAGVFSPSFWFSDSSYIFAYETGKNQAIRYYLMGGTSESSSLVHQMNIMMDTLLASGFSAEELLLKVIPGGQHNEQFWRSQFTEAYKWLFLKEASGIRETEDQQLINIRVSDRRLYIEIKENNFSFDSIELKLYAPDGQMVFITKLNPGSSVNLPENLHGIFIAVIYNDNLKVSKKIYLE